MGESKTGISGKEQEPKSKIRVLIVEDEPDILHYLERVVDMVGGYKSTTTDNTVDALRILKESRNKDQSIDLVFSDLGLIDNPDGGLEIAKAIKVEKLAKHFILFTGSALKFEGISKEQLEEKGINSVIGKPASTNILVGCFENVKEIMKSTRTLR